MKLEPKRREPKVQRGISVSKRLYDRITEEADRYGMTWNEVAEQILARVLLVPSDSSDSHENINNTDKIEVT